MTIPKEFKDLRKSIAGVGAFGVILPICAHFVWSGGQQRFDVYADAIGFSLVISSVIHLAYVRRLGKMIRAIGTETS